MTTNNPKTENFELKLLSVFGDEIPKIKYFYANLQKENHDVFSKILLFFSSDERETNGNIFYEYISLRALYIVYSFLCFENNKYNLNDILLGKKVSGTFTIDELFDFLKLNFFIYTSSFSFYNTEIDKILVGEIFKSINGENAFFDFSKNNIVNKGVLLVLENDFRFVIGNSIGTFETQQTSDKLKFFLIKQINNSIINLSKTISKTKIDGVKGRTKTRTKNNLS